MIKKTRSVNLSKKEGEASMSEVKLNEVQKYFDDKISNVKENIHNIDKRLSVMENELGHLSKSLESIPEVIESSVRLTLDKIEKEKKGKMVGSIWWPNYHRGNCCDYNRRWTVFIKIIKNNKIIFSPSGAFFFTI